MRSRNNQDLKIIQEADLEKEALRNWVSSMYTGNEWGDFRCPSEVFEMWFGEVKSCLEKTKDKQEKRRIYQKVLHTKEVVEAGLDILRGASNVKWNLPQAAAVCLLHDIARFRQALMGGFSDIKTNYDHAEEGAVIIEANDWRGEGLVDVDQMIVADAVRHHSKRYYEGENIYAKYVRDADKLALLRFMPYFVKNSTLDNKGVTAEALDAYLSGEMVKHEHMKTRADLCLAWGSWESDLNFEETKDRYSSEGIKMWIEEQLANMLGKNWMQR